ncbi:MAG: Rieske 2Fe-2S domain-containing protein [Streptosporangiales bacterium]
MSLSALVARLEHATVLDRVADPVRKATQRVLPPGAVRDALHGVWLGHPVHPPAVQLPLGAFIGTAIIDLLPGPHRETEVLLGVGVAATLPAVLAGAADLSESHEQQQRVGVVHAAANVVAVSLYSAALVARRRNRGGKALGYAGLAVATLGGFLGGHLSQRQATGANHAEEFPHLVAPGWQELCGIDDLPEGQPRRLLLDTAAVLALRQDGQVWVLSDRCSHFSGPLHQGEFSDGCVTCPWHGSRFRLDDGAVVRGPATAPQPAFDVRVEGGRVLVCLPGAG